MSSEATASAAGNAPAVEPLPSRAAVSAALDRLEDALHSVSAAYDGNAAEQVRQTHQERMEELLGKSAYQALRNAAESETRGDSETSAALEGSDAPYREYRDYEELVAHMELFSDNLDEAVNTLRRLRFHSINVRVDLSNASLQEARGFAREGISLAGRANGLIATVHDLAEMPHRRLLSNATKHEVLRKVNRARCADISAEAAEDAQQRLVETADRLFLRRKEREERDPLNGETAESLRRQLDVIRRLVEVHRKNNEVLDALLHEARAVYGAVDLDKLRETNLALMNAFEFKQTIIQRLQQQIDKHDFRSNVLEEQYEEVEDDIIGIQAMCDEEEEVIQQTHEALTGAYDQMDAVEAVTLKLRTTAEVYDIVFTIEETEGIGSLYRLFFEFRCGKRIFRTEDERLQVQDELLVTRANANENIVVSVYEESGALRERLVVGKADISVDDAVEEIGADPTRTVSFHTRIDVDGSVEHGTVVLHATVSKRRVDLNDLVVHADRV